MLDIKKSYAYRQISAEAKVDPNTNELTEGNIFEKPEIQTKSGLGVKSDMIDLTKTILKFLIDVALNDSVPKNEKYNFAIKELKKFHDEFLNCLNEFDVQKVGTPVRWQKKINAINAMKIYNATVEKTFQYLTTGHLIYCEFASMKVIDDLKLDITSGQKNAIAFPQKFDSEKVKTAFRRYGIQFDIKKQWENIFNKTCKRLLEGLKREAT